MPELAVDAYNLLTFVQVLSAINENALLLYKFQGPSVLL